MSKLKIPERFAFSPHVVLLGAGASKAAFENGDANGKKIPLMNELVDCLYLDKILIKYNINCTNENFEDIYSDLVASNKNPALVKSLNKIIYDYFSKLDIPNEPTLYDYLLLSLKEKDLIATFNWDPFLALAYQRNRYIKRLPEIVFLHGNVFVGICDEHNTKGFINCACSKCNNKFSPVDLLYPIKEKNYNNNLFIKSEWNKLQCYLEDAYLFTIFGYSAPKTDVEAIGTLKKAWMENKLKEQYQVEIIDIASRDELKSKWAPFIFKEHRSFVSCFEQSYLYLYPRRSCEAFAASHLMCNPLPYNKYPKFINLAELHEWLIPLLEEEEKPVKGVCNTPLRVKYSNLLCNLNPK